MKRLIYILFLLTTTLKAQINLVPNGSFEEYSICPMYAIEDITVCDSFFNATEATCDYFNSCSTDNLTSVPNNYFGSQYAYDGEGYVGLLLNSDTNFYYREYLTVKLKETLKANKSYSVSMYVVLTENSCSINNDLGLLFTDTLLYYNIFTPIYDSNAFYGNNVIEVHSSWVYFNWIVTMSSKSNYLTIGNFKKKKYIPDVVNCNWPYLYIDSIVISPIDISIPNIFTPNNDGINDYIDFSFIKDGTVQIFNRWGNMVFEANDSNNYIWNGGELSDGVYFYVLNSNIINKQGTIHLLR